MVEDQIAIPCTLMRGGTSKGPYFLATDLPQGRDELSHVLLAVMGSPDVRQIDGIGGADTLTSKVAMVSHSKKEGADVDFLFCQVSVDQAIADFGPSCGNILTGVGPFAIEQGLVDITGDETTVRIHSVNTGAMVESIVQTRGGYVNYTGNTAIHGVPGTAAPIVCRFSDIAGSKTGALLPTGQSIELINGIEVTLIDVSMPMMILRAKDVGIVGTESRDEINLNNTLFNVVESLRLEAGQRMGLGDVTHSVLPKVALLSEPAQGGTITSRYLVPNRCHATHAITGGMAVASCCQMKGTVADGLASINYEDKTTVMIEHPSGTLDVEISVTSHDQSMQVNYASVLETARKLFRGDVFIPNSKS